VRFEIQKGTLNSKLKKKKLFEKKYVHNPKIFVTQTLLIPRKIYVKSCIWYRLVRFSQP
jgi:hypothetical protein